MNQRNRRTGTQSGRIQWGSYGFLAGILLGVLIGWSFAGFVGALIRVGVVVLALAPLVLLYVAWRKIVAPRLRPPVDSRDVEPVRALETRAVVHGAVGEPHPR